MAQKKLILCDSNILFETGNHPTPGGNNVVNKAFINFMERNVVRTY